jgi:hypothetical protein
MLLKMNFPSFTSPEWTQADNRDTNVWLLGLTEEATIL